MSYHPKRLLLMAGALCAGSLVVWLASISTPPTEVAARVESSSVAPSIATPNAPGERLQGAQAFEAPTEPHSPLSTPASEPSLAITAFNEWANSFAIAAESERTATIATGIAAAKLRQVALRELISTNPQAALEAALTWEQRQQLPAELQPYLERQINTRADYEVTISDDLENLKREVRREATINGERFQVFTYGQLSGLGTTANLPINGIAVGNALALAESPIRVLSTAEASFVKATTAAADPVCSVSGEAADSQGDERLIQAAGEIQYVCRTEHVSLMGREWLADTAGKWQKVGMNPTPGGPIALDSWSQGPKTVLFMRVNFPDDLTDPISESAAYDMMNSVSTWIVENSYGSSSMITTVTPLLTLPNTKAFYAQIGDGQLLTDARTIAKQAGYDTADFTLDAVRFTNVPGYSYGGKAYVRGKGCWLQSSSVGVACHEFGHNYGLWHANFWTSSQASGIGPGSHNEYGDVFDTMGSASAGDKHFNANHRNKIDWLGDNYVQTATGSGTYRLHAFDVDSLTPGRFYALKLNKDFDREYWVELRQRFASNPWIQSGVLLRWDPWADSAGGAHLLDTTPGSPAGNSSKDDAAIVLGRTFVDAGAGLFITPVSMQGVGTEKSVDVVVKTGSFPGNQLPTVAVQASATQANTSQSVIFTAAAADADGDPLAYEWDFGDFTFGPNSPVITNAWSTAGEYVVRCRVSDLKGGFASGHILVRVGNPTTFSLSGRITDALGNPVEGVRVHNGSTSSSTYRGGFTDSDGSFIITRLAAGTHTISTTLYGYSFAPLGGWSNPVTVGPSQSGIDFTATAMPVVGWQLVDSNAAEAGGNTAVLRLSRTGPTGSALTIKYKRAGTAAFASDYTLNPTPGNTSPYSLSIPAGASFVDVTVTPLQDTSSEGPETVLLTLAEDATYKIGWRAEARVDLADDENPGTPSVYVSSSADDRATETGSDTASFTITRTGNRTAALTVRYTLAGTATANLDYTLPTGQAIMPAGETSVAVTFPAIDDNLVEGDETIVINVSTDPAYVISGGTTTLTIQDDDPPLVKLAVTDDLAVEGGSATARIVAQRIGSLASPLTVNYTTSGTATSGSDFTALSGSLTIPAGESSAAITITAINDAVIEGDESVAVILTSSVNYNIGLPGTGIIIIQDNELPTVTITASDATATEGGADTGTFTISRGAITTGDLTVQLAISGQAIPADDYVTLPDSVVIPTGSSSVTLSVTPVDDSVKEADEKVTLTLNASIAYNLGTTAPVSITLKDNDSAASIATGFESSATSVLESQTSVRLPVVLSAASASAVSVNYAVVGGSAQSGTDYTLAAGTVSFLANQTLSYISFFISNDSTAEANETISIELSAPTGAGLDARTTQTLTIVDDDASVLTITATDASAAEAGGTGTFRIARTGSTAAAATALLQITGTASGPADYSALPTSVTIPADSTTVDITVTPVNDQTDELDETVIIRLSSAIGGRVGSPSTATVTIVDNDNAAALPQVTIAAIDDVTTEGAADQARVAFSRSGGLVGALVIHYGTSGSALAGADVPALSGTVTIADGQATAFLDLQATADGSQEPMEELVLSLAPDVAYNLGAANFTTIHVVDSPFMSWQLANFSPLELAVRATVDPAADPDGDGLNNFTEYAFNRNPKQADATPLFTQTMMPLGEAGDQVMVITHQRRILRSDVSYVLGVAANLGTWDESAAELEEVSVTADPNGLTETVATQVLAPVSHFERRFVRLKVVRP